MLVNHVGYVSVTQLTLASVICLAVMLPAQVNVKWVDGLKMSASTNYFVRAKHSGVDEETVVSLWFRLKSALLQLYFVLTCCFMSSLLWESFCCTCCTLFSVFFLLDCLPEFPSFALSDKTLCKLSFKGAI